MPEYFDTIIYFMIFFPMIYVIYNCLKAFDYAKILRRGKIGELKVILFVLSVALSYLLSNAVISVIDRLTDFFI